MEEFKVGDIVRLKSENIKMVIEYVNHPDIGQYSCVWINGDKKGTASFSEDILEKIEE